MTGHELRQLQSMINRAAKAATAHHKANGELMTWCREHYGYEPGDVDADEIIDAVCGGCGPASGMTATEFDEIMMSRS